MSRSPFGRLRPGGDENEVGGEAEDEPECESPGDRRLTTERSAHREELHYDVEDRSSCECEEGDRDGFVDPGLAEQGSEEGGAAGDQSDQQKEAPARKLLAAGERADNAEALRRIVQPEADDQHEGETDVSCTS